VYLPLVEAEKRAGTEALHADETQLLLYFPKISKLLFQQEASPNNYKMKQTTKFNIL
jgi:hypothetical protein